MNLRSKAIIFFMVMVISTLIYVGITIVSSFHNLVDASGYQHRISYVDKLAIDHYIESKSKKLGVE